MSLAMADNLTASTSHAIKTSGHDPDDDLCTCGYATCSAKTRQVSNPLEEPLCTTCIAARNAFKRKKAKMNKRVRKIGTENQSPDNDEPKCQNRKRLTTGQKLQMIELFESKIQVREIARRFACVERTVYSVIEKASDLRKEAKSPGYDEKKKSIRSALYPEVEEGVAALVKDTREHGLPVTQATIIAYAESTKERLLSGEDISIERKHRIKDFCASHNWAKHFIKRSKLRSARPHGDEAGSSVDQNSIREEEAKGARGAKGIEEVKLACGNYRIENIFNVDEAGLFFRLLPRRTYVVPSGSRKTARGTKDMSAKDRIALYVCTNATGSAKVPVSIIGRSRSPRCFEGKRVPVKYFSQANAWSDEKTLRAWFDEVFLPFARQHTRGATGEKVLLLVSCRGSGDDGSLNDPEGRVRVMMLPPNCIDIRHQPMATGIIAATKLHYRRRLLRRRTELIPMVEALRDAAARMRKLRARTEEGLGEGHHQPHLLDAAQLVYLAWGDITQTIISRCWARASTLPDRHQAMLTRGSAQAWTSEGGMPDMGSLSAAVDDLSRMLVAIDNLGTEPWATELIEALSELGIEPGSSPDQAAVDAIADWAVIEDREDVADALRSDREDKALGITRRSRIEDSDNSDNEDTAGCTRTLEEEIQILRTAEEIAAEAGDHKLSRHLQQFRNSLTSGRAGAATAQGSGGV